MTYQDKIFSVLEKISGYPIANTDLANSTVTVAGHSISLGGSQAIAFTDLSDNGTGEVANSDLASSSITINGTAVSLGGTRTIATATPNVVTESAAYTASNEDYVLADASSGAFTVTLPAPAANDYVVVKKTDSSANAVTVSNNSGETIDGASTKSLASQYDSLSVTSDGTNWYIV